MAKPIAVIKINIDRLDIGGHKPYWYEFQHHMEQKLPDYHVFVSDAPIEQETVFDINVFHENSLTEIQYEELKQMVEEAIKTKPTNII